MAIERVSEYICTIHKYHNNTGNQRHCLSWSTISKESARLCTEAGIGFVDLAGNARLSFDQIFIETQAAENPFLEKRSVKSVFSPKATRVLRVLLQGPMRPWKVKDLAAAASVSLGQVSAIRQQLLAQEWAEEEASGLRVTKPDAVLDAWAAVDRCQDRTTVPWNTRFC